MEEKKVITISAGKNAAEDEIVKSNEKLSNLKTIVGDMELGIEEECWKNGTKLMEVSYAEGKKHRITKWYSKYVFFITKNFLYWWQRTWIFKNINKKGKNDE